MLGVLGLDPLRAMVRGSGSEGLREVIGALVTVALEREAAGPARTGTPPTRSGTA
jgi:hypothetical protein